MSAGCAVIVGHGPGIGEATARALGERGHDLALLARDGRRVEEAAGALAAGGGRARGYAAEAGSETSLLRALDAARADLGEPEVLVYNAAHWRPGPVLALPPDALVEDFRVCVAGALTAARAVAPGMQARGRGAILFTGGGFALHPSPAAPALSIGKGGIRALALMLAQELAPARIRVGTVTIMGAVGPNLPPERVAQAFLGLMAGPVDPATAEVAVRPGA